MPTCASNVFHAQKDVVMQLPARIGDYTDFYSSYHHAHNVGTMLRGPENCAHAELEMAAGCVSRARQLHRRERHRRASPARARSNRRMRKRRSSARARSFDYELETAFLIGPGNTLGEPVPIDRAADHIFGLVLMNDWSARDIQTWEYQPLGPFLAKNFCTSISPWVVTLEALEPFRKPLPAQDPDAVAVFAPNE